ELGSIEQEFDFTGRGWRLVRQENRYLGAARNRAAAEARGEFLLFMDDDNVAKPNEITTFASVAWRTGADVLTCLVDMFEGSGVPRLTDHPTRRWLYAGANPALSVVTNTFGDANALCRRTAFLEVGGFAEEYGVTHEDWELFARFMLQGYRLAVIPEPLFWYRSSRNSMSNSTPVRANYARSLGPHLATFPRQYHSLVEMIVGQSVGNPAATRHRKSELPMCYRVVDAFNEQLQQIPLMHRILRIAVQITFHVGQVLIKGTHRAPSQEENPANRKQSHLGPVRIRRDGASTPRPTAPRRIMVGK